jgi:hypothetical protein
VYAGVVYLIAGIDGTGYAVVAVDQRAGHADIDIAGFRPVAVYAVVTIRIYGALYFITRVCALIAHGAPCAGIAAARAGVGYFIAGLGAVAEQAVVRAVNRCSGLAAAYGIADRITVTELPVFADGIIGDVVTPDRSLIA